MSKRKSKSEKKSKSVVVRAAKPVIVKQTRTIVAKRAPRRRSSGGSFGGLGKALLSTERVGAIAGAYLLGVLDAKGTKLPTIPVLGRAGTVGVALYYLGRHVKMPMVSHAATGFLSVAAYEMGNRGTIAGDLMGDAVVGDGTV